MKKAVLEFISIFVIGCMFFSCNPSTGNHSNDDDQQQEQEGASSGSGKIKTDTEKDDKQQDNKTDEQGKDLQTVVDDKVVEPKQSRHYGVTFDFEGAQAIAKLESENSRAAASARNLGDLVKIKSDGSMENAIIVEEDCCLSDIVSIYKSPDEESKEIFLVLNGESTLGHEEVEKQYEWGETYKENQDIRVGQLIGLKEDGSIADILKKENATDYMSNHMSLKTDSITFDAKGNIYFISSDNGDMIYQYNPKTNELTKMVAAVENTWYEKMKIDDEGEWIFVSGQRNSAWFLRAIPINNPNAFVNVYYSSSIARFSPDNWIYDNNSDVLYFIAWDGDKSGLFTTTKVGGFKDKKFIRGQTSTGLDNFEYKDLFKSIHTGYSDFLWNQNFMDEDYNYSAEKVIHLIIDTCNTYYASYYYGYDKNTKQNTIFSLSIEDIDIRFDSFCGRGGKFELLYNRTIGKKNVELFKALDSLECRAALHEICYDDYYKYDEEKRGYIHNFLADIFYIKNTDILLKDYNGILFSYYESCDYVYDNNGNYICDEEGNYVYEWKGAKEITGTNYFRKNNFDLYEDRNGISFVDAILKEKPLNVICYDFVMPYSEVLDYFYSFCNVDGEKEFRLTAFKDDEYYSSLYSTLTDEAALEWLASDVERLSLFNEVRGIAGGSEIINLLGKTCYIKGTDDKAITWDRIENFSIYYDSGSLTNSFYLNDSGVYYECTDNNSYYYLVQIADSNGKIIEKIKKIDFPTGKVVRSERYNNRFIMQFSITDFNGAELGYHHIYAVNLESGYVTNCFDNVPNRNSLEVVSFNSAGDLLYYSAVRGTAVENGIVNLVTNEYNPLTVQRKMVAVYTFN